MEWDVTILDGDSTVTLRVGAANEATAGRLAVEFCEQPGEPTVFPAKEGSEIGLSDGDISERKSIA